jgi:REP element-mobilizing transposase RayT
MVEYKKNAHAVWDVKYHLIRVTKYRYKVLRGRLRCGHVICLGKFAKGGKYRLCRVL